MRRDIRLALVVVMEAFMAWSAPEIVEVCLGMEVTAYAPAQS